MRNHKHYTIFIVECNKMYSFMFNYKLISNPNYSIISYSRAGQCIQYLHLKPDIIVLDYNLVRPNGIEVLKTIKENSPATSIIILSEHDKYSIYTELIEFKDLHFVIKDKDSIKLANTIIQKINNVVEMKKNKRALFKQRIILFSVSLIIIIISIIIFIF